MYMIAAEHHQAAHLGIKLLALVVMRWVELVIESAEPVLQGLGNAGQLHKLAQPLELL